MQSHVRRSVQTGTLAIFLAATASHALVDVQPEEAAVLAASLERPDEPGPSRRAAAVRLLSMASTNLIALDALDRMLAGPMTSGSATSEIVAAIAASDEPPPPLLLTLEARADATSSTEELVPLLRATAAFRSRHAARMLVRFTTPDRAGPVADAARASLETITGRDDLPTAHGELDAWMRSFDQGSELDWQRMISLHLTRRAERDRADAALLTGRLIDTTRRLHLLTPADKRAALLVELMKDPHAPLRDMGFELAARELANNGSIDPSVGTAAVELLASPDAFARGQAALLVRQIAPPNAAEAVSAALARETDPNVASDLLLAATRRPTPASVSAVLAWLARGGQTRPAAIEACLQITRSVTIANEDRDQMLAAVRSIPLDEFTPAAATLLADQGDADDRLRVAPLLRHASVSVRIAAAESLLWHPEHEQAIVEAAESTPELVPVPSKVSVAWPVMAQGR